jgi:low temperature requirement protein LtrA
MRRADFSCEGLPYPLTGPAVHGPLAQTPGTTCLPRSVAVRRDITVSVDRRRGYGRAGALTCAGALSAEVKPAGRGIRRNQSKGLNLAALGRIGTPVPENWLNWVMTDGPESRRFGHAVGLLRPEGSATQASFVELFFDLFVVFTLTRLVSYAVANLSPDTEPLERWITLARALLMLLTLLWAWTITTYVTAWFDPKRPVVQIFVVSTAFGMLIMGASILQAFDGRAAGFAYPYVIMQLVRTLALGLMLRGHALRRPFLHATAWYGLSTVPWLIGVPAGGTARIFLWSTALLIDLGSARAGWPLPGLKRYRIRAWAAHPRYLASRFQQLLMISLGEPLLAVGIIFSQKPASPYRVTALLTAFLTTVLLWRIYYHVAGELLADALLSAGDRARAGRIAGVAQITMICGIVSNGVGHEIIQSYPSGHTDPAWLIAIIGSPAVYLAGRTVLERVVFSRTSRRRLVAIAILLLLAAPSLVAPPTAAAVATGLVLLGLAAADTRQSWNRPSEQPSPLR